MLGLSVYQLSASCAGLHGWHLQDRQAVSSSLSKQLAIQFTKPTATLCRILGNRLTSHPLPTSSFTIRSISWYATAVSTAEYRGSMPSLLRCGEGGLMSSIDMGGGTDDSSSSVCGGSDRCAGRDASERARNECRYSRKTAGRDEWSSWRNWEV